MQMPGPPLQDECISGSSFISGEILGDEALIDFVNDGEGHWFRGRRTVVSRQTAFQAIEIVDVAVYGRLLFLDGALQSSENDEHIYHEALIHPALCLVAEPKRVLVIGGGEGASAREALRHPSVECVTMVDIDPEVVDLCRQHLGAWHQGAFEAPSFRLVIRDGVEFIATSDELFDVVVIDVVDSFTGGPAEALYTTEFYRAVRERLAPGGALVIQGMELGPIENLGHLRIRHTLAPVFPTVRSYSTFVPSFWCEWGFVIASDAADPLTWSAERVDAELRRRGLSDRLRFYDGRSHRRMFELTKSLRTALDLT